MLDNTKRIENLETRLNGFESTLREIKDAIVGKNNIAVKSDDTANKLNTRETNLSRVEVAKIQNIMDNFDFYKVHDIMERLDWKWAMTAHGVPTVDELKKEAHRLLVDACYENTIIATGGFRAVYEEAGQGDPDPYIALEFIVEECEGFDQDDED